MILYLSCSTRADLHVRKDSQLFVICSELVSGLFSHLDILNELFSFPNRESVLLFTNLLLFWSESWTEWQLHFSVPEQRHYTYSQSQLVEVLWKDFTSCSGVFLFCSTSEPRSRSMSADPRAGPLMKQIFQSWFSKTPEKIVVDEESVSAVRLFDHDGKWTLIEHTLTPLVLIQPRWNQQLLWFMTDNWRR